MQECLIEILPHHLAVRANHLTSEGQALAMGEPARQERPEPIAPPPELHDRIPCRKRNCVLPQEEHEPTVGHVY